MVIGVNTRFLLKGKMEGIGWFTFEVFRRVVALMPEHQFVFFFDRPYDKDFLLGPNVKPVIVSPPARHPFLWYWWFENSLPKHLKKEKVDLFISPDGYLSLNTDIKEILVIHDLAFEHYQAHVSWLVRKYYTYFTPKFARKAEKIITVSQYTKDDIIKLYGIPGDKIEVAYNGCNEDFHIIPEDEKEKARTRFTGGKKYFIYVGALHPRKNILGLLTAFEIFKTRSKNDIQLVIAGRKAWGNREMQAYYEKMNWRNSVVFPGHLERNELNQIVAASEGLVYPSFFEGFGLPILEAMYAEVPVIASNTSSMPEVAGDAAILIEPNSPEDIALAMMKMLEDKKFAQDLVEKGRQQREKFSWDIASDKVVKTLTAFL